MFSVAFRLSASTLPSVFFPTKFNKAVLELGWCNNVGLLQVGYTVTQITLISNRYLVVGEKVNAGVVISL